MRLVPVLADTDVDLERHLEFGGAVHEFGDFRGHGLDLLRRHLEHEFVVDLHDHARTRPLLVEPAMHGDHGALDNVGRRALHGRVDGAALRVLAPLRVTRVDLGQV